MEDLKYLKEKNDKEEYYLEKNVGLEKKYKNDRLEF